MIAKLNTLHFGVLLILAVMLGAPAFAQQPDLSIESLFEAKGWSPGVTIPLSVKTKTNQPVEVISLEGINDLGLCRLMRDPYRVNVILLRCKDELENLKIKIGMLVDGKLYSAEHGPLSIKYVFANLRPVDKDPKPDDPVVKGQKLFNTHCFGCHNPASSVGKKTTAQIQAAILAVPQMKTLSTTKADLDLIAAYLKDN